MSHICYLKNMQEKTFEIKTPKHINGLESNAYNSEYKSYNYL